MGCEEVGQFLRDHLSLTDDLYMYLRGDGASSFSKAMAMDLDELKNLITRCRNENSAENISKLVDTKYTENLEVICDGTYIFTNKSGDLEAQKRDFSGQKKAHLRKLHIHVSTRGYIILVTGFYFFGLSEIEL